MKKLSILFALTIATISMMGAVKEKCFITMTSSVGGTDVVKFYAEDGYTDAFENGNDVTKNWNAGNPTNVNIYSPMKCGDLSSIVTNVIKGLPIAIKTNELSTDYTFTFSKIIGTVYLEDMLLDSLHLMKEGETYQFTAAKNATIANRFRIYKPFSGDEGEWYGCFMDGKLVIYNNPYIDNIVITDVTGAKVKDVLPHNTPQTIDLSDLTSGNYTLNLGAGQKELVINVK